MIRLAIGLLVDGCLGEGVAADVAAGARSARDPAIRTVLEMIASDEATHAELGWDVLAWCLAEGGAEVGRAVEVRIGQLGRELAPQLPDLPGLDAAALAATASSIRRRWARSPPPASPRSRSARAACGVGCPGRVGAPSYVTVAINPPGRASSAPEAAPPTWRTARSTGRGARRWARR